ncbi:MAG: hypothetical protein K2J20_00755 [Bacilli bacterium]|nr:hypothetical protein [Bacilli bacterium]
MLNKNGWCLKEMLLLSGIIILFLGLAVSQIYGLTNYYYKEVNDKYYQKLEKKLEEQTLVYLNDYYKDTLNSDGIVVTKDDLQNYNLDVTLIDGNGSRCHNGYVMASKSRGEIKIKAYISCNKYETLGYEGWRV